MNGQVVWFLEQSLNVAENGKENKKEIRDA